MSSTYVNDNIKGSKLLPFILLRGLRMEVLTVEQVKELKKKIPMHHNACSSTNEVSLEKPQGINIDNNVYEALFSNLAHMNVILTNACNLSCTYCFEQHNTDYGKWTIDKLGDAYKFLARSKSPQKAFQFFGGEPLLRRRMIFEFLEKYHTNTSVNVRVITNGLLLDKDFIDRFLSYDNTNILLSLDTLNADKDHRGLTQEQIFQILETIVYIRDNHPRDEFPISIRCTISQETALDIYNFLYILHQAGVRSVTVHPLTMSLTQGFIDWDPEVWEGLNTQITSALENFEDLFIEFSEGVGSRSNGINNCLVGNGMIAIDGSGDISGCYFLNNLKKDFNGLMLGNIFDNKVYIDRYKSFDESYQNLFKNPECDECEAHGLCYQCPVGNFATSGTLFRPDNMCKKIVNFHQNIKKLSTTINTIKKAKTLAKFFEEVGEDTARKKVLLHLASYYCTGYMISPDQYEQIKDDICLDSICSILISKYPNTMLDLMETACDDTIMCPMSYDDTLNHIYQEYLGAIEYTFSNFDSLDEISKIALLHVVCLDRKIPTLEIHDL